MDNFVFGAELFFVQAPVSDPKDQASRALGWLEGPARIWVRSQVLPSYPLGTLTWSILKKKLLAQFKPVDSVLKARRAWWSVRQTGSV